jgi:hypothetical protein
MKTPWLVEFNTYGGYDCMTDSWDVMSPEGLVVSVDLGDYGQPLNQRPWHSPRAKAVAYLIAAAPEVLAALKRLVDCPDVNLDELEVETQEALLQARKAIDRAVVSL